MMKRKCFFTLCASVLTSAMMLTACDDPIGRDDPEKDAPEDNALELLLADAAKNLEAARNAGKIIASVDPVETGNGGFAVRFADGSSVSLGNADNSKNGVTPILTVDSDGWWLVSYDGNGTYEKIVSPAGSPISAAGVSVKASVESDGCLAWRFFAPAAPDKVTETVRTNRKANPVSVLQSAVLDAERGTGTLTLADGKSFPFSMDVLFPTEITVLKEKIILPPAGQARFDFSVSPSNARFIPVTEGDGSNLHLAGEDGTDPKNFRLVKVERSVSADGKIRVGQYTATVEDLGVSAGYSARATLVLATQNRQGEPVRLSSRSMDVVVTDEPYLLSVRISGIEAVQTDETVFHVKMPYGTNVKALRPEFETNGGTVAVKDVRHDDFTAASAVDFSNPVTVRVSGVSGRTKDYSVVVHHSSLPVVYVTTSSEINSKEYWTEACGIQIWNAGEYNGIFADVQMKGRGNSTWTYEKRPYAIKLGKKAEVLGMPKHKRWVLLANYLDHTCMRNAVAFEIARRLPGLDWTPRGVFVELVMNGEFLGNYYLCEQIKVDENRVNITEINPSDIVGDAVTGGYLFELDSYYDELFKFKTSYKNLPVQFKDPDEDIADEQLKYGKDYFNKIESILFGTDKSDIFDYIDLDSFVDWFLVHNLALNSEPIHPKSCFMNKDRGGKLKAGPVWDFDYGTFQPSNEKLIITSALWYGALFKNSTFTRRLKERWTEYKEDLRQVEYYINDTAEEIRESAEANIDLWPIDSFDSINHDAMLPFGDAVERLKSAYRQRMEVMDKAIKAL